MEIMCGKRGKQRMSHYGAHYFLRNIPTSVDEICQYRHRLIRLILLIMWQRKHTYVINPTFHMSS